MKIDSPEVQAAALIAAAKVLTAGRDAPLADPKDPESLKFAVQLVALTAVGVLKEFQELDVPPRQHPAK